MRQNLKTPEKAHSACHFQKLFSIGPRPILSLFLLKSAGLIFWLSIPPIAQAHAQQLNITPAPISSIKLNSQLKNKAGQPKKKNSGRSYWDHFNFSQIPILRGGRVQPLSSLGQRVFAGALWKILFARPVRRGMAGRNSI